MTPILLEHRKVWVVERLAELSKVFAIEVCAYAVMSNHTHVVLRVDQQKAQSWSEEQVMAQWEKLFSIPVLVQQYKEGTESVAVAIETKKIIAEWRLRLMDISWYMRSLNEHLARRANEEDRCTGRFWSLMRIPAPATLVYPCTSGRTLQKRGFIG